MEKRNCLDGTIVTEGNYVQFKDRKGRLHNIAQTEELRKLADSNLLCVFNKAKTTNANDDFWELDEVLGDAGIPETEIMAMIKALGFFKEFPKGVMRQIEALPSEVRDSEMKDYMDLRHLPFVTIDPDTAKDYDDAVYAETRPDGSIVLTVAISNVAHYIKPDSPAFKNAMIKGNSGYFAWLVDHMFPTKLSNGICSINEGQDRLVMCKTMTITPDGNISDFMSYPAVICSRHRLTYKESDFLYFGENADGDTADHSEKIEECKDCMQSLENLYEVAFRLYKARMLRGAMDIDTPEFEFIMSDDKKKVLEYMKAHEENFTSVIEETAVLANEVFGDISLRLKMPACYRNHNSIDFEKVPLLNGRLAQFGLHLPKNPHSKDIQMILDRVKGKRIEEHVVHMLLNAMDSAYYSEKNLGHAGLAVSPHSYVQFEIEQMKKDKERSEMSFQEKIDDARMNFFKKTGSIYGFAFDGDISHGAYCQSTSPIRRGGDLINQNQELSLIMNDRLAFTEYDIQKYCDNLNARELAAAYGESSTSEYLFACYAKDNIGKIYEKMYVVSIGEHAATLRAQDGFLMQVPYDDLGIRRKHVKIGQVIDRVAISSVRFNPNKVYGARIMTKKLELSTDDSIENEELSC